VASTIDNRTVMRDLRPKPSLAGSSGLPPWLAYHGLIYVLIFGTYVLLWVWWAGLAVGDMVVVLGFSLVVGMVPSVLPTVLLTALLWTMRRLGRVAFRMVAVVLCCLPLVCVPSDFFFFSAFVPVQVAYGLILRQPRPADTTDAETGEPPGQPAAAE
jgi:hypothetical protein